MTAMLDTGTALEKTPLERYVPPAKPSLVGLTRAALADALVDRGDGGFGFLDRDLLLLDHVEDLLLLRLGADQGVARLALHPPRLPLLQILAQPGPQRLQGGHPLHRQVLGQVVVEGRHLPRLAGAGFLPGGPNAPMNSLPFTPITTFEELT